MKAATAHKMILNMISTAVMVKIGKVYENLMVDVNVSNKKLKEACSRVYLAVSYEGFVRLWMMLMARSFSFLLLTLTSTIKFS